MYHYKVFLLYVQAFIKNFVEEVRSQNQKYGIFVQTLAPRMVFTQRTEIVRPLKSFQFLKFMACDPNQYARHAITVFLVRYLFI